jgi:hypothetical protein
MEQDRMALPFKCTVQAPHCAMPQPYLVPVKFNRSRKTHKSGILGSASTECELPLILSLYEAIKLDDFKRVLRYDIEPAGSQFIILMVKDLCPTPLVEFASKYMFHLL